MKKKLRIAKSFLAAVFFMIPCLSVLVYDFAVYKFTPSAKLASISLYGAIAFALVLSSLIIPLALPEALTTLKAGKYKDSFFYFFTSAAAPFFGAYIGLMFIEYPLNYMLHAASPKTNVRVIERVTHADGGRRYCRRRALLEGGAMLYPVEVCRLSWETVGHLRDGGAIELYGEKSTYGISIQKYRAL
jgi:hypothetical protein